MKQAPQYDIAPGLRLLRVWQLEVNRQLVALDYRLFHLHKAIPYIFLMQDDAGCLRYGEL